MTDKAEILKKNGIETPEGEILDLKWTARFGDWYVKTQAGWFWYDAVDKVWRLQANGPS